MTAVSLDLSTVSLPQFPRAADWRRPVDLVLFVAGILLNVDVRVGDVCEMMLSWFRVLIVCELVWCVVGCR